jgi:hypothetical protein
MQERAIDNSFRKVNVCVTLREGAARYPAFRVAFCIFSFLWLFASISAHVLPFQGFAITIIVLLWTSDQLDADTSVWKHTTLIRDEHLCPRRDFEYLQYKSIRSWLHVEFFAVCGLRRSASCRTIGTVEPRKLATATSSWAIRIYFAYLHLNTLRYILALSIIF